MKNSISKCFISNLPPKRLNINGAKFKGKSENLIFASKMETNVNDDGLKGEFY